MTRGGGSGVQGPGALAGTIELRQRDPGRAARRRAAASLMAAATASTPMPASACRSAAASSPSRAPGRAATASSRSSREQRGAGRPAFALRAGEPRRARASRRCRGGTELQASALAFSDERERGTAFSGIRTRGRRRVAAAGRAAVERARLRPDPRLLQQLRQRQCRPRPPRPAPRSNIAFPSTGLGARLEARPDARPAGRASARRRLAPDRGRDPRAFRLRRRRRHARRGSRAGGRGRSAASPRRPGPAEALTLTAGGRIDRWTISNGRLHERVLATGAVLTDTAFRDRSGWEPTGRAGIAWRAGGGLTLRGAAYLGWRLPTLNELYRPVPGRRRRDRRQCRAGAGAAEGRGGGARLAAGAAGADRRHPVRQPARRRDRQRHARPGAGHFPGVGFVAAGGDFRQRAQSRRDRAPGRRAGRPLSRSGAWTPVAAAGPGSMPRSRRAAPRWRWTACRPAQTPRHSLSSTLAWAARAAPAPRSPRRYAGGQYEDDLNRQRLPGAFTLDAAGAAAARPAAWRSRRGRRMSPMPGSSPESAATGSSSGRRRGRSGSGSACAAEKCRPWAPRDARCAHNYDRRSLIQGIYIAVQQEYSLRPCSARR